MPKNANARHAGNFGEEQRNGQENGNKTRFEAVTSPDVSTEEERRLRTLALVRKGREWVRSCPEAWRAAQEYVLGCALQRKAVEWHDVASVMLRRDYLDYRTGSNARLDNTVGPLLMRWLVVLHPEVGPFVRPRRSMFDAVEIGGPYDV